jgi:hypothetical protein
MRPVCFFHAGCPDGFGAAWSVWRAWGEGGRYLPRGHEDALDARDFQGAHVVFVDIAPDNESLHDLTEQAERVVVLDHHVSSRERYMSDPSLENRVEAGGHLVRFDLEHSGAVLAWHHFHPDEPVPALLRYVEDQDLWSWKLPRSEEVNAAIGSYARDFEVWSELAERPSSELAEEGVPLLRAQRTDVARLVRTAHPIRLDDRRAEAVNAPQLRSAIGHELAKRAAYGLPWGAVYRIAGTRVDVSIYSVGDLDVSRIAAGYGGGGHRNAAGFSVSVHTWLERFV